MTDALNLVEYYRAHGLRVFQHFGQSAQLQDALAVRVLAALSRLPQPAWTSALHEALGGHVPAADLRRALEALQSAGLVRGERVGDGQRGRPGWRWWLVHRGPDAPDPFPNGQASSADGDDRWLGEDLVDHVTQPHGQGGLLMDSGMPEEGPWPEGEALATPSPSHGQERTLLFGGIPEGGGPSTTGHPETDGRPVTARKPCELNELNEFIPPAPQQEAFASPQRPSESNESNELIPRHCVDCGAALPERLAWVADWPGAGA